MKGWLDKYQDGGPVTKTKDDEVVGFLKNLITPEVTRSDAPARITTAPKDQSLINRYSKIWDVVSHPVTAFKHLVNEGRLPNNFAAASPLGIDTALDITGLNPLGYASLFHDMGASALNLVTGKGSLSDLITLPVTGMSILPGAKTAANIVGRHMEGNSNFYSPIFNTIEKGANKIGSKVKQVDQKLGEKVFTSKGNLPSVPDIDPSDLESLINYNLNKGQGIKKLDLPINVKVNKAENVAGNYLTVNSMLDGKQIGSVILEQNLNPFKKQSLSRGVIDAIYPKGNAWANTPGFKKISDYPFSSIDYRGQIEHAGTSYNYNDLINSGVSGELNKAINETLKANNLGNIISGGTGHSTLGKKRWDNLVSKGHAENLGPGKYKLKENGGWLDKYEDGGELNYNDASTSAGPGFQGDGYSNVGRNYSPAWGGQFKEGGKVPATKQDSLNLYNNTKKVLDYYNNKRYEKKSEKYNIDPGYSKYVHENNALYADQFNERNKSSITAARVPLSSGKSAQMTIPESMYYKKLDDNRYMQRENANAIIDTRAPMQLFDKRIAPTANLNYINDYTNDVMSGDIVNMYTYDPILVKPVSMLTPEERTLRIERYGEYSGIPNTKPKAKPKSQRALDKSETSFMEEYTKKYPPIYVSDSKDPRIGKYAPKGNQYLYKKPKQSVISQKPEHTPQSTIDFMEGNYGQEPITEIPQQSAPSWGEVVDPRTGYTHMTRQGSPMYPMVGQRVPDMAMGGSIGGATQGIPGATGFMYARVSDSTPSKAKGRNKEDVTDASAENGKEMKFYQEGLDFKPKSISKNGSKVIKDDRGQWAHPGEITEIGSNQITMRGVPYPVMGISDTGDMQMMYPNEEYQYDGESVTEYPMMAQGGQLTKLDQLTNFTNYNTKQPGGWLDKYQ